MAEEEKVVLSEPDQNYIDAIKELKENTVDKGKYMKLVEENKQLLNSLISGEGPVNVKADNNKEVDLATEVDNLLFGHNHNLDYIRKTLELRDQLIKDGKPDPFVTVDPLNPVPSQDKLERAQQIADTFQECIDYADGDVEAFSAELQRRCVDPIVNRFK